MDAFVVEGIFVEVAGEPIGENPRLGKDHKGGLFLWKSFPDQFDRMPKSQSKKNDSWLP